MENVRNKKYTLSDEWRGYLTIANIVLLIGMIISTSRWVQKTEDEITTLAKHAKDKEVHMPLSVKIKMFVPRTEIDSKFESLTNQLNRIEDKLDLKK